MYFPLVELRHAQSHLPALPARLSKPSQSALLDNIAPQLRSRQTNIGTSF